MVFLTDAVGDVDGLRLAEHGHAAVTILLRAQPVLVGELGHGGDLRRERLLVTLGLLETQDVWGLLAHPLGRRGNRERDQRGREGSERERETRGRERPEGRRDQRDRERDQRDRERDQRGRERDKQQTNEKCSSCHGYRKLKQGEAPD